MSGKVVDSTSVALKMADVICFFRFLINEHDFIY